MFVYNLEDSSALPFLCYADFVWQVQAFTIWPSFITKQEGTKYQAKLFWARQVCWLEGCFYHIVLQTYPIVITSIVLWHSWLKREIYSENLRMLLLMIIDSYVNILSIVGERHWAALLIELCWCASIKSMSLLFQVNTLLQTSDFYKYWAVLFSFMIKHTLGNM